MEQPKAVFPAIYNPFRRTDFCVHRNTARCVLRHSKLISCPKTLALAGGWKLPPKSGVYNFLIMDL